MTINEIKNAMKQLVVETVENHYEVWFNAVGYGRAVWVFNITKNGDTIGRILTDGAYRDMLADMNEHSNPIVIPAGYFAHVYDYGYNYQCELPAGLIHGYMTSYDIAPIKEMDALGNPNVKPLFMVIEYRDEMPSGEYGISDSYDLVGVYEFIDDAEDAIAQVRREVIECTSREVKMKVANMGQTYKRERRIQLGSSWYME